MIGDVVRISAMEVNTEVSFAKMDRVSHAGHLETTNLRKHEITVWGTLNPGNLDVACKACKACTSSSCSTM